MFARTPRLFLRPGWPEDAPAITEAIAHEAVTHRLENVPFPYDLADAQAWLARPHDPTGVAMLVLRCDRADMIGPDIIGVVSLIPREDALMLGYWYAPAAWGRGYATEAGRAVVDIAQYALGMHKLSSRYHADNPASGNVLRKLGFRETGTRLSVHSRARGHAVEAIAMELDLATGPEMRLAA